MQRTYQEAFPHQDFSHLARTVEQYFSNETPLWWVDFLGQGDKEDKEDKGEFAPPPPFSPSSPLLSSPIACLWVGTAIDQIQGHRHSHIFLLYVVPEQRRRGIGTALMRYVENWAKIRGDHQIGLQVFQSNTAALNLYNHFGYQTQSLWMVKPLNQNR